MPYQWARGLTSAHKARPSRCSWTRLARFSTVAWADFNGDGKSDFCSVDATLISARVQVVLSDGTQFGPALPIRIVDGGAEVPGGAWIDVDGDKKADYVRLAKDAQGFRIATNFSDGTALSSTVFSQMLDPGKADTRFWVDATEDGLPDFIRTAQLLGEDVVFVTPAAPGRNWAATFMLPVVP